MSLIINQTKVTDNGVQVDMLKEISAQDLMWYIGSDKKMFA